MLLYLLRSYKNFIISSRLFHFLAVYFKCAVERISHRSLRCHPFSAKLKYMKILIIEDEANIVQLIRLYLEQANFIVISASDGVSGLELHAREHPDLVILDLMLPALDGMEVCRRIRAWASTPILMLTARTGEEDRIAGLELGADDYLVKPFSPRELVSRVKAILRRSQGAGEQVEAQVVPPKEVDDGDKRNFGNLSINIPSRRVEMNGQRVNLTV